MPRFQKITTVYPEFELALRRQNPDYARLSYQQIYELLIAQSYGWSDFFARNLRLRGYEAEEQFINLEILQKAWAKENDVRVSRRNWVNEIALAQIKKFQPDVLFLEDLYVSDADFRVQVRAISKPALRMIGWRAAPTADYLILKDLDLVLTCAPVFTDALQRHGIATELMSHGFDPPILDRVGAVSLEHDFTFIGMISLANGFHQQRYAHVSELLARTTLEVWGEIAPAGGGVSNNIVNRLAGRANQILDRITGPADSQKTARKSTRVDPLEQRYPDRFHQSVFGLDNFRLLGQSRTSFNCHIDSAETSAGNARLFEGTGMGTCLITDWKTNLPQLFEPDKEVVTYRTIDECIEKVNYLLAHEEERAPIAAAGQRRTLRDHTYEQRAAQLDEIIRHLLHEPITRGQAYSKSG
jgi:hypothetical protein